MYYTDLYHMNVEGMHIKWANCEVTAEAFLTKLDRLDIDYLLFGSWARKHYQPEIYCQDIDVFSFGCSGTLNLVT